MKRYALVLVPLLLAAAVAGLMASSVGARPKASPTQIVLWHGYTDYEGRAIKNAVATYNRTHPRVHVTAQFSAANDFALEKLLTAIAGGMSPDIAYLFGSWAANIAKSPKTLNLTRRVKQRSFHYDDLWPAARAVGKVDGKVI